MIRFAFCMSLLLQTASVAAAQTHLPYASIKDREIKSLSEQQIADLKAGRGMGLALPAELNGYPGPMHVLEHADAMRLTPEQRKRTAELIASMKNEAIPLGERLIESEAALDRLFSSGRATPVSLQHATQDIGLIQGRLREAHLKYHLAMVELLSPEQVARYRQLRGYTAPAAGGNHPHHPMRH